MIRIARSASVLAALLSLLGCFAIPMTVACKPRTEELRSPAAKSPLYAGIYYSSSFAEAEHGRTVGNVRFVAKIGQASVKVFDGLLPLLFEKITPVASLSVEELALKGVDLVIVPSLEHFEFRLGFDKDSDRQSIVYRTTLYNSRLVPISSWLVVGNAKSRSGFTVGISDWLSDDVTDAGVNYLNTFHRETSPAMAAIMNNRENPGTLMDMSKVRVAAELSQLAGLDAEHMEKLGKAGIVSLRLSASNQDARRLLIRASDMRLQLKDGRLLEPATLGSVINALDSSSQASWLIGGAFLAMAASSAEQTERNAQFKALTDSMFGERTLADGKEEVGIVSFKLPNNLKLSEVAMLSYWVVDPAIADGGRGETVVPVLK